MLSFYYRLFGLNIQMPFDCPLLQPAAGKPDVHVTLGSVPEQTKPQKNHFLLTVTGVGKYWIKNGNAITIDVDAGVSEKEVRLFLLGSAMGSLLHQRSLLVLHGCAVEFEQGVVVFVAPSGTGKSTLASHFYRAGFNVFGDDQAVVDVKQGLLISPGLGQIKLWKNILDEQGWEKSGLDKVQNNFEKYIFPVDQKCLKTKKLIAVVELEVGDSYQLNALTGSEKLQVLVKHTYRNQYLSNMGLLQQHFCLCGEVANSVFLAKAIRPQRTESTAEFFSFILQQLKLQGIQATAECV